MTAQHTRHTAEQVSLQEIVAALAEIDLRTEQSMPGIRFGSIREEKLERNFRRAITKGGCFGRYNVQPTRRGFFVRKYVAQVAVGNQFESLIDTSDIDGRPVGANTVLTAVQVNANEVVAQTESGVKYRFPIAQVTFQMQQVADAAAKQAPQSLPDTVTPAEVGETRKAQREQAFKCCLLANGRPHQPCAKYSRNPKSKVSVPTCCSKANGKPHQPCELYSTQHQEVGETRKAQLNPSNPDPNYPPQTPVKGYENLRYVNITDPELLARIFNHGGSNGGFGGYCSSFDGMADFNGMLQRAKQELSAGSVIAGYSNDDSWNPIPLIMYCPSFKKWIDQYKRVVKTQDHPNTVTGSIKKKITSQAVATEPKVGDTVSVIKKGKTLVTGPITKKMTVGGRTLYKVDDGKTYEFATPEEISQPEAVSTERFVPEDRSKEKCEYYSDYRGAKRNAQADDSGALNDYSCPGCKGPGVLLKDKGQRVAFRCRDCRTEYEKDKAL